MNYLAKPFAEYFILMLIWFLLMTGPELYFFMQQEKYEEIPYFLSRGFLTAYIFTLIYGSIKSKVLRKLYVPIIFVIIGLFLVIDLFCITNLHDRYSYDMAAIILGTNPNEAGEFLSTYISWNLILLLIAIIALSFALLKYWNHIHMGKTLQVFGIVLIVVSVYFSVKSNYMLNGIYAKYHSFFELPELPDLNDYQHDPIISFDKDSLPKNIVIVIGEAFAKSHSSLYGYEKETNPLLSSLTKDSTLIIYDNVISPATHTLQAFQYILNTWQLGKEDKEDFAESITIANVARYAGYETVWISNQSKHGQNDNLVGEFADLCDKEVFVDNKFSGLNRWSKDGEILPILDSLANDDESLDFFFVHLMGSHFNCRARYPDDFDKFQEEDYSLLPVHQRKKVAEYDNSVLYNDYVVANIIKIFKNKESVVIYFPDHGMDIYETAESWCGHARDNDTLSVNVGRKIPFMIYLSPSFISKYPQKTKEIKASTNNSFCTDKIIYSVMDIMNVHFRNNDDVIKNSFIKHEESLSPVRKAPHRHSPEGGKLNNFR